MQRVPVRIELLPDGLTAHPLRVGLSMDVTVDVRDVSGNTLADIQRNRPIASTDVFDELQRDADTRVRQIVAANGVPQLPTSIYARTVAARKMSSRAL